MKISIYFLSAIFLASVWTGCSESVYECDPDDMSGRQVLIGTVTRTTADGGEEESWEDGLTMTVHNLDEASSEGHTFTYSGGIWNRTSEADFLWPGGNIMEINAYIGKTGASANEFALPVSSDVIDQTDMDAMEDSDFLYYTGTVTYGNALDLNMRHVLAKLVINVSLDRGFEAGYTTDGLVSVSFLSPTGMSRTDPMSGWVADNEEATLKAMVSALSGMRQTVTALVVPGEFTETISMTMKAASGEDVEMTAEASGFVFEANHQYSVDLSLINRDGLIQAEIGDVTVQDWGDDEHVGNPDSEITSEVVVPWDGTVDDGFDGGTGTADDPYRISTGGQLALMRNQINSASSNTSANYLLTSDIDLNGIEWTPAGMSTSNYFNGTFDGGGHTISGLSVNSGQDEIFAGLFGYIRGTIRNLTIENPRISTSYAGAETVYAAALVAQSQNVTIENCHISGGSINAGDATGTVYCGSITGQMNGNAITACSSTATISGLSSGAAGGIVGFVRGSGAISGCYTAVSINVSGNAGGIIGQTHSSFSSGSMTGCYSISAVSGTSGRTGGIIGSYTSGTLSANYCTGSAQPAGNNAEVNGLDAVGNIDAATAEAMNKGLSGSGWSYIAAATGSVFPYIATAAD